MANFETPKRFWSKVAVGDVADCWEWQASEVGGYGQFWIDPKLWQAHRVAWILTFGPIPTGLHCCHKCDNPGCCNPYHLFLGTRKDNMVDAAQKGHKANKLTEDEVLEIRESYNAGRATQQGLADEFGVSQMTISQIIRRKRWAWL